MLIKLDINITTQKMQKCILVLSEH